jgi:hypothetical protein
MCKRKTDIKRASAIFDGEFVVVVINIVANPYWAKMHSMGKRT